MRTMRTRIMPRRPTCVIGLGLVLAGVGCGHDTTGPAPRDPSVLLWQLDVNHRAVTLATVAPYDTVQLHVTPRTLNGTPLPAGVTLTYSTSDANSVAVSSTGLVTARAATPGATITVAATAAGVSDSAQVLVQVTDGSLGPPSPLASLTLTGVENPDQPNTSPIPGPGEGLTVDCAEKPDLQPTFMRTVRLTSHVVDASGMDLSGQVPVVYTSSDPKLLADPGVTTSSQPALATVCEGGRSGPVTITATATVYGVTRTASLALTVIPDLQKRIYIQERVSRAGVRSNYFDPGTIVIGERGIVIWYVGGFGQTHELQPTDVVFDVPNPAAVAKGVVDTLALGAWYRGYPQIYKSYFGYGFPPDSAGGNIAPFTDTDTVLNFDGSIRGLFGNRARQFPIPGTYHYHSASYGTSGTIIVRPWLP